MPLQDKKQKAPTSWAMECRNAARRTREGILPLSSTSESLEMECCMQFCAPQHQKDMDILEAVQCRATKVAGG